MMKLLFSLLACCGAVHASFDTHAWQFRHRVAEMGSKLQAVTVSAAVFESSKAKLHDLRLVQNEEQVPYVLKTLSETQSIWSYTPTMVNKAALPGVGVQAIVQLMQPGTHNQVTLTTRRTNFRLEVQVETSEDGLRWGVVRRGALIYDISTPEKKASDLSVSYPDSTRSFIRVMVKGWTQPADLQSIAVSQWRESEAQRDLIADLKPQVTERLQEKTSILRFDLVSAALTIASR